MHLLNLGILAHVDAGKTSLTERLLYTAGVIDDVGSVDDGSTQTDTLALERARGITIKSAVVSFAIDDDFTVNLIDTPGHPDFIAEVERVLGVLDGAVLVVSAVEGVQAQTRLLMRTLRRLGIPTLIFVNKTDRREANPQRVFKDVQEKLTAGAVAVNPTSAQLLDVLAEHDDGLLAAYVHDEAAISPERLRRALRTQTGHGVVHPVYCGSAVTGAGVESLISGIREFLPPAPGDETGPVSGTVFKVERGPAGEKVAYVRMFSGAVQVRDQVRFGRGHEGKVTRISGFDRGASARRQEVVAGEIGKLWGLADIQVGDPIGLPAGDASQGHFAPPTLETVIVPHRQEDKAALRDALGQLAEQDPLINVRQDDARQEIFLSLYGEVQKEVIQATLADDFGVDVEFRETSTICVERPAGTGEAVEFIYHEDNPFLATVGLRVDPAPEGTGVRFGIEFELGALPPAFLKAVEDTVMESLCQGPHGWEVTDCMVTMTHSGYAPRQSHAHQGFDKSMSSTGADFRGLTPLVLMNALKTAGTVVCEPIQRICLEFPADTLSAVLAALARLGAVPGAPAIDGPRCVLDGEIPAARMHELERQLPALARGEGMVETSFSRYVPVRGPAPTRGRTDMNPLDRKDYLLRLAGRRSR